jgi:fatty-acyl-CoA synthase
VVKLGRFVNVAVVLEMAADGLGGRRAIGELTYAEVRAAARAVAGRVCREGSHALATGQPNGAHLPIALFGAAWAGASYAPLNFRLPPVAQRELLAGLAPVSSFDATWLTCAEPAVGSYPEDPDRPAVVLYTSGTTSAPKAAQLHHANLVSYLFNTAEFGSAGAEEATLLSVPPFHIAGVAAVLSSTYVGRRIVAMPHFEARQWLRLATAERVTHTMLVPTMLARIVSVLREDPSLRPPALRSLAYGGARTPRPVLEQALELLPGVDFVNAYGLTETSSTVALLGPDDHRDAIASSDPNIRRRLDSVGRSVPGIEFAIEDGELWIRGHQVGAGYANHPSSVDGEGWLHTGDRASLDDGGYLFITGRADDLIIRGGENISPSEIEDTLLRHEHVAAAVAVGLPDEEWGERVAALVVAEPATSIDVEALRSWAQERLGSLKTPELIVITDELPTTDTGKVLRRAVRAQLT